MSWTYSEETQYATFTFAGSISSRRQQGSEPEFLVGRAGAMPEFFWGPRLFEAAEYTDYDVHVTDVSLVSVSEDEIATFRVSMYIKTDDGELQSLVYEWQEPNTWPNTTWGKDIAFSAVVTVPMKITAQMGVIDPLTGTKIWKDYPTAKSAGWFADPELKLSWERDLTEDVTIAADLMGITGLYTANTRYTADSFGMIACRMHASAQANPGGADWGQVCNFTLATGGCLGSTNFGTHDYTLDEFTVLSLSGSNISCLAPAAGLAEGPAMFSYVPAYDVVFAGGVRYLDGEHLDPDIVAPEDIPEWDPVGLVWLNTGGGTTLLESTGGTLEYGGWWEMTGLFGYGGDYMGGAPNTATCLATCLTLEDGEYRGIHGPLSIVDPGDLGQPQYTATADPDDEAYSDCRVLLSVDEESTIVRDLLHIVPTYGSRQVVEWLYADLAHWTYDPAKLTMADDGTGKLKVTCVSADGTMSIDYADCRKTAAVETDNWLGVRFLDVDITGSDTTDFKIAIAGRTYAVSTDKQRVDVLACEEALPSPPTQSLLPTFLPEAGSPPSVTDIPKDMGIYQPGTITLSGFTAGKSYILDGITLVRTTTPQFIILPEAQWVGWNSNFDRDPGVSGDPPAFHQAATATWAHRTGVVVVDGMIAAEIVSTIFTDDGGYTEAYPALGDAKDYFAFPHPITALFTVSVDPGTGRTWGMEYEWDGSGDVTKIPIGCLVGPVVSAAAVDVQLQFCRLNVPANMARPTMAFDKRYGALGLVRVADTTRNYQVRAVDIETGCKGNYSAATGVNGAYLTWGTAEGSKTLSQHNEGHTLHEWKATVTDGDGGDATYEARNRALSILTVQSGSPAGDPPYVPQIYERLWQPDPLGSFLHPNHPLGV